MGGGAVLGSKKKDGGVRQASRYAGPHVSPPTSPLPRDALGLKKIPYGEASISKHPPPHLTSPHPVACKVAGLTKWVDRQTHHLASTSTGHQAHVN